MLITETCFGNQIGNTFKYLCVYPFSLRALNLVSLSNADGTRGLSGHTDISTDEGKLSSFGFAFLFFPIDKGRVLPAP